MAKINRTQEFDNLAKKAQFVFCTSNSGGYSIVVSDDGEGVLWRSIFMDREHTAQRWQQIKWTSPRNEDQEPRPYFTVYGSRYYLDNFMRA